MPMSKSAKSYINISQKIRTVIRHVINGGYCLVIATDPSCFSFVKPILENNGIDARLANFTYSSVFLDKDASHIISIVIDIKRDDFLKGIDIINTLEKEHSEIPYVVSTDSKEVSKWISNQYPKVNILTKTDDMHNLVDALGVSHCA